MFYKGGVNTMFKGSDNQWFEHCLRKNLPLGQSKSLYVNDNLHCRREGYKGNIKQVDLSGRGEGGQGTD